MNILKRTEKETAREYAFRVIKQNIISLDLAPGAMVSENELAKEMGISRTPIREALIELNELKAVEIYPQKGSVISLIDVKLVEEVRYVRLILETAVVELACDVAKPEDIIALENNYRQQKFYLNNPVKEKQIQIDNEFHELIFTICKMDYIHKILDGMMIHFERACNLSLLAIKESYIIADHKALISAIRNKDKVMAKEILIKHLSRYKIDENQLKAKYPKYFK